MQNEFVGIKVVDDVSPWIGFDRPRHDTSANCQKIGIDIIDDRRCNVTVYPDSSLRNLVLRWWCTNGNGILHPETLINMKF